MSNVPLTTMDSDMPVDANSIPVTQTQLPANIADFIDQLTADGKPPFRTALIKGTRDSLAIAILRQCRTQIGETPQARDFANYIQNLVKPEMSIGPDPAVIFSMSVGGAQRGRVDIAEPSESAVFATIDAETDTVKFCSLPPAPEMPDMRDMSVRRGVVLMVQPLLNIQDPTGDNRGQGVGPGAEVITLADRNRDPLNSPREDYMGGQAFSKLFANYDMNDIARNLTAAMNIIPEYARGLGQNPPQETASADALEEAGIAGAASLPSAVALGAAYSAPPRSGPAPQQGLPPQPGAPPQPGVPVSALAAGTLAAGGERRATANLPNYPNGRRDVEVAERQRLEAAHAAAEHRAEAQHQAGAYEVLKAEEGVETLNIAAAEGQAAIMGEAAAAIQETTAQTVETVAARQEPAAGVETGMTGEAATAVEATATVAAFEAAATAETQDVPQSAQDQNSQAEPGGEVELAAADTHLDSEDLPQLTIESAQTEREEPAVGPASMSREDLAGGSREGASTGEAPAAEGGSEGGEKADIAADLARDEGTAAGSAEEKRFAEASAYEETHEARGIEGGPRPDEQNAERNDRPDQSDLSAESAGAAATQATPRTGHADFAQEAALHHVVQDIGAAGAGAYTAAHLGAVRTAFTAPAWAAHTAYYPPGFTPAAANDMGAAQAGSATFGSKLFVMGMAWRLRGATQSAWTPSAVFVSATVPAGNSGRGSAAMPATAQASGRKRKAGLHEPLAATAAAMPAGTVSSFSPSFARRPLMEKGAFVSATAKQLASWRAQVQSKIKTARRRAPKASASDQARTRVRQPTQAKAPTAEAESWSAKADGKTRAVKKAVLKFAAAAPAAAHLDAPTLDM